MKAGAAITLLLLSAFALAAHAKSAEEHHGDVSFSHHVSDHHDDNSYRYKQPIVYKQPVVYKQQYQQEYYCTYFYYDYGYFPSSSGNWYETFQSAVTQYAQISQDVYGCSFGDNYNYGFKSAPASQGGYVCFKSEASPLKFWNWFYSSPYCSGFSTLDSSYCHYQIVKSYNLPQLAYTYHY